MQDPRFTTVKKLFEYGEIKSWRDIVAQIPTSVLRVPLHTNHYRMSRIIDNPAELQYDETAILAGLIGVEHRVISELIEKHIKESKRKAWPYSYHAMTTWAK